MSVRLSQFVTYAELYRLVSALSGEAREILDNLPSYDDNPDVWLDGLVEALGQQGLLSALQQALVAYLPERRHEILGLWPEGNQPSAPLRRTTADNPYAPFSTFVGRTSEIAEVKNALNRDTSVFLIAGRRCGKTAILKELMRRLDRPIQLLDTARWDLESEDTLRASLAQDLGISGHRRRDITEALKGGPACILAIDEADRLLSRPYIDDFLVWIRSLDDKTLRGHVRFIWAGAPSVDDYQGSPANGSPFANTTERIYLRPLDVPALQKLLSFLPQSVDFSVLRQHCGGHPWYWTEVLKWLWEGHALEEALQRVVDHARPHARVWTAQLGKAGPQFLRDLSDGMEEKEYKRGGSMVHWREVFLRAQCLALVEVQDGKVQRGPGLFFEEYGQ